MWRTATSQMPVQTEGTDATVGDRVTMHCKNTPTICKPTKCTSSDISTDKYNDSTGNYTQTVLVNNKQVAKLSTKDGHAQGWGSAVECADTSCGSVGAHSKFSIPPLFSLQKDTREHESDT